ncbi:MAG: hypothetical protein NT087_00505 [Deltaproteobacteria bacterium]|nr:hypothetical protein [Deltaproteobacteria bacterium]
MKKVLSTVAALGLIAGLASTASAVEFKMSGKYLVEGAYLSDSNAGNGIKPTETSTADNASNAYWLHTFEIKPTMVVNDKISMSSVIRLADDTFWGSQTSGDVSSTGTKVGGTAGDVYVHQLYMDYASPIGKMRFGRTPAGTYGTSFMDYDGRGDRIMLWPSFLASGPVTTLFYFQKSTDNNYASVGTGSVVVNNASDADSTKYVARVYYNTDSLDSGIEYAFMNNQLVAAANDAKQSLTVYGKYKMDNLFANAEAVHFFGSKDYDHALVATADQDYDSWAAFVQVGAKIDALTPSLAFVYAEGQKLGENDIQNALTTTGASAGTGDQFELLYILTGRHTGILNNDIFSGNTASASVAGVHALVAAVDYAVSNQLTLHGAIGWAKADEKVYYNNVGVLTAALDDSYGWEYNVGAAYKLLDNLTYEAHFGYLDAGDYFNGNSATDITKNVYVLTHSLTMTF